MSEFGITPKGLAIKRFDQILLEMHDDLSTGFGVNTRLNPKSFLNVELTAIADKLAELWEFGEQIYHSQYPYSAEGLSLDNAVQFGGIARDEARPTYYAIHVEAVDGTTIPKGTLIRSDTAPAISFTANVDTLITRSSFSRASIRLATVQVPAVYTAAIDGVLYSYASVSGNTTQDILAGLSAAITSADLVVSVIGDLVRIESVDVQRIHTLVLSGNLTTDSVTGLVTFASEDKGEIVLPDGTINQIVTMVPGLISVVNLLPYISGRLRETDVELRQSYADKIYARSSRMLESIRSAILRNVQGVESVAVYQNDTDAVDSFGRYPHCVEIVVDGGSDQSIAEQIWDKKADGISTFGDVEVTIPGDEGEPVVIRFNRPEYVYVWFRITITMSTTSQLPPNYVSAVKSIILEQMRDVEAGKPIVPQTFISELYRRVPGIAYIDIPTFSTTNQSETPGDYTDDAVPITPRQRAVADDTRIEVILGA
jgi:uncharacterized phage protein gp47/JayE